MGVPTLLAIEAKADEAFGDRTVNTYLQACAKREEEYPARVAAARAAGRRPPRPSNARGRIERLCAALFGPAPHGRPVAEAARPLRYQLVTALVGALIETRARGCMQGFLSFTSSFRGVTQLVGLKARRRRS